MAFAQLVFDWRDALLLLAVIVAIVVYGLLTKGG